MHAPRSRQIGMGALGWLVTLAVASFVLTCFFKIGPVYLDYWQVKGALDDVMANPEAATMPRHDLLDLIQRHFDVSRIEAVGVNDIHIKDNGKGRELDAGYEKRVPLIANIDVVVKFPDLKFTLSAPVTE
jgi:hypothetical protein